MWSSRIKHQQNLTSVNEYDIQKAHKFYNVTRPMWHVQPYQLNKVTTVFQHADEGKQNHLTIRVSRWFSFRVVTGMCCVRLTTKQNTKSWCMHSRLYIRTNMCNTTQLQLLNMLSSIYMYSEVFNIAKQGFLIFQNHNQLHYYKLKQMFPNLTVCLNHAGIL